MGVDRWAALFSHQTNIREVMAFPKTQSGADLMLDAPSEPDPEQYSELGLRFVGFEAAGDVAGRGPAHPPGDPDEGKAAH
jgi:aspartyl-tRNA synthetase